MWQRKSQREESESILSERHLQRRFMLYWSFYLFHTLCSFRPLTLEWTVLYNVNSEQMSRGLEQTHFSGTQQQDKGQQSQTET